MSCSTIAGFPSVASPTLTTTAAAASLTTTGHYILTQSTAAP